MPRSGPPTYTYTLPPIYLAIPGTTITAAQHNDPLEDIASTFNTVQPIVWGGTGASNAAAALAALGAQPTSATLTALLAAFTPASASTSSALALAEDTDNGVHKVAIQAPASVASDKTQTLQDVTGTIYVSNGTDVAAVDGGTGFGAYTVGDMLYADSTTTLAKRGVGAAGTVLTVNAGATAPAYEQPDVKFLESGTISAASLKDIDLTAYIAIGYSAFDLNLINVRPATDNVSLNVRVSANGGSSFVATGYEWASCAADSAGLTGTGSDSDTAMTLMSNQGNAANESVSGSIVMNAGPASFSLTAQMAGVNFSSRFVSTASAGRHITADVNAIRLLFSSGNITSGAYVLSGLRST